MYSSLHVCDSTLFKGKLTQWPSKDKRFCEGALFCVYWVRHVNHLEGHFLTDAGQLMLAVYIRVWISTTNLIPSQLPNICLQHGLPGCAHCYVCRYSLHYMCTYVALWLMGDGRWRGGRLWHDHSGGPTAKGIYPRVAWWLCTGQGKRLWDPQWWWHCGGELPCRVACSPACWQQAAVHGVLLQCSNQGGDFNLITLQI